MHVYMRALVCSRNLHRFWRVETRADYNLLLIHLIVVQNLNYRFPNDTELNLIMKNQFSAMSVRFKTFANAKRIDQFVECLIELYNEVYDAFTFFFDAPILISILILIFQFILFCCCTPVSFRHRRKKID